MKASLAILLPALALGCQSLNDLAPMLGNTKVSYTLKNGEKIEGTLLQSEGGQSVVQVKYGAVTVATGDIAATQVLDDAAPPPEFAGRLATLSRALRLMAEQPWGGTMMQVPAVVVGLGSLKNVPYVSLRAGNFEFNVYGDPEAPAGLEIGMYGIVNHQVARKLCRTAIARVLRDGADRAFLETLSLDGAKGQRDGLTFEVTPATAPDAFGGWWITVTDDVKLAEQRAADADLARISIPRADIKTAPAPSVTAWRPHELRLSRPEEAAAGRVYLRGVHRKQGAWVVAKSL